MKGLKIILVFLLATLSSFSQTFDCDSLVEVYKKLVITPGDSIEDVMTQVEQFTKQRNNDCHLELIEYKGVRFQYKENGHQEMLEYYEQCISDKLFINHPKLHARALIKIAQLKELINEEIDELFKLSSQAYELAKSIEDVDLQVRAGVSMAKVHGLNNDTAAWQKQFEVFFKLLEDNKDYKEIDRSTWIIYSEYITGCVEFGFLEQAKKYIPLQRVVSLKVETKEEASYSYFLNSAKVAIKRGNHNRCIKYIDSIKAYPEWYGAEAKADAWKVVVPAYYHTDDLNKCLQYADSIEKNLPLPSPLQFANKWKYKCYKKKGQLSNALLAHEQFKLYTDSLKTLEGIKKVEGVKRKIASLKQEERIKLSEQRQAIYKSQRWLFAGIAALIGLLAIIYFRQGNRKKVQELQREMAEVQLASLKSQMNPHFMFNSINSIKGLIINEAAEAAADQLTRFSKLMRSTLNYSSEKEITLEEEIEFLKTYSELERFKGKVPVMLKFNIADDVNISNQTIVPFLIQPFIENAYKHAFHNISNQQAQIQVSLKNQANYLIVEVEDNGIGIKKSVSKTHISKGTELVEKRLELHNKESDNLSIEFKGEGQGTLVQFRLKRM